MKNDRSEAVFEIIKKTNPLIEKRNLLKKLVHFIACEYWDKAENGSFVEFKKYLHSELRHVCSFYCDGYYFDEEDKTVHWYEIDATNKTSDSKIESISWLNDYIFMYGWGVTLHILHVERETIINETVMPWNNFFPGSWKEIYFGADRYCA